MKQYRGNQYPFCCALFTEADAPEALAVLETLAKQKIRCAVPKRRRADCVARAAAVLLFLSPEAVRDRSVLNGISTACAAGKPILTVYLRETQLTPGLAMQLNQMQAIPKYREESDETFERKLLNSPVFADMSVTPQQKKAFRRHALIITVGSVFLLVAGVLIGLYWRPIKAMLPTSALQTLGVPLDLDGLKTLYIYGETTTDAYIMPDYRKFADGEHDWTKLNDRMIPQGDIARVDDFALFPNLKELCICNNRVRSFEPITSLKQLTLLDVSHNQLSDVKGIGALSELETLNVSYNAISALDEIAALSKLRVLNISYTDVSFLDSLASMPALETVYIDANQLIAADKLGETPFDIVCLNTPVYRSAELQTALNDPLVTDICIMRSLTVPQDTELTVRPGVFLTAYSPDTDVTVNGSVQVEGVWEMNCNQAVHGTVTVKNGGVCCCSTTETVISGVFRVEEGGRHNLEQGASFVISGGRYQNDGDIFVRGVVDLALRRGSIVNNGSLYLRAVDLPKLKNLIPTDLNAGSSVREIYNNGIIYVDGFAVLDGTNRADGAD